MPPLELRLRPPLVTGLVAALCVGLYLAVAGEPRLSEETLASYWIYANPGRIWDGAYWGLLAAPFVHLQLFHLLFNLVWLWGLGRRVEAVLGHQAMFALVFFGAIIPSGVQLALGSWPALGLSGVIYVLFGLVLGLRRKMPLFALYLRSGTVRLLLGWLLLSFLIADSGIWPIGAVAQLAGLALGWAVGRMLTLRRPNGLALGTLALLGLLTVSSLLWLPWSPNWIQWRYTQLAKAGQYREALELMQPLARMKNPMVLNNLAWTLATARDASVRDGARATQLAREALARINWAEPSLIDTLAAAYAEAGQWPQAEAAERLALKTLDQIVAEHERERAEVAAKPMLALFSDVGGELNREAIEQERRQFESNLVKLQKREKIRE